MLESAVVSGTAAYGQYCSATDRTEGSFAATWFAPGANRLWTGFLHPRDRELPRLSNREETCYQENSLDSVDIAGVTTDTSLPLTTPLSRPPLPPDQAVLSSSRGNENEGSILGAASIDDEVRYRLTPFHFDQLVL